MNLKLYLVTLFSLLALLPLEVRANAKGSVQQIASLDDEIISCKEARAKAKMRAAIAGREADRFLTQDWLSYRLALKRQEYYQSQVELLDAKIAELEKKKREHL